MITEIHPQNEFPLLDTYSKVFAVTADTIFAYDGKIYSNNDLPNHLIIHENVHLKQQAKLGLEYWVENYLKDPKFRLDMEVEAYRKQVYSIADRNARARLRWRVARDLSSDLYGNIITFNEAVSILS